jgi:hypothetical protein
LTLVFAAVTTSIVLFTVGLRQMQASAAGLMSRPSGSPLVRPQGPTLGSLVAAEVASRHVLPAVPAPAAAPQLSATEIRAPTLRAFDEVSESHALAVPEPRAARPQPTPAQRAEGMMHTLPRIDLSAGPMDADAEDPLATAMHRALSRRPEEVTQTRRRPSSEDDSFARFTGPPAADEAAALLADLHSAAEPPLQLGDDPDEQPGRS